MLRDGFCPTCGAKQRQEKVEISRAIESLLVAKKAANLRPKYLQSLRLYLTAFARWYGHGQPVSSVDVDTLERWFSERGEAPATRASNVGRLSSLLGYSVRRGWIDANPCDRLERPRLEARAPRILTPDEGERILHGCLELWPRFLAALVLMLFCGVRPAEVQRIAWGNVTAERVVIDARASKVRARRVVRIRAAAAAWIAVAREKKSELPCPQHRRHVRRVAGLLGWWEQDCLRHSAASYMLAESGDVGQVATELGNSPGILLRHYTSIVDPEQAAAFWKITPGLTGSPRAAAVSEWHGPPKSSETPHPHA